MGAVKYIQLYFMHRGLAYAVVAARILQQVGAADTDAYIAVFEVSNLRAGDKTTRPGDVLWLNFLGPEMASTY